MLTPFCVSLKCVILICRLLFQGTIFSTHLPVQILLELHTKTLSLRKVHNHKKTNLTGSKVPAVYSRSKSRNNYISVWHTEEIVEGLMLSSEYDNSIGSYYVMRWKVAFCHTRARQFPCEVYLLLLVALARDSREWNAMQPWKPFFRQITYTFYFNLILINFHNNTNKLDKFNFW